MSNTFCPILNYREEEITGTSVIDFYKQVISQITSSQIEISLASHGIQSILATLYPQMLEQGLELSWGSVSSVELFNLVSQFTIKHKIFAPAFDQEVHLACKKSNLEYIPGVAQVKDFQELITWMPNLQSIKIFPVYNQSLLRTLEAPYPELRLDQFRSRINTSGILVSSPREYQQIRKDFMRNDKLEINIETQGFDISSLIKEIKKYNPAIKLIGTGFDGNSIQSNFDLDETRSRVKV